jgi:hypothetical protein
MILIASPDPATGHVVCTVALCADPDVEGVRDYAHRFARRAFPGAGVYIVRGRNFERRWYGRPSATAPWTVM